MVERYRDCIKRSKTMEARAMTKELYIAEAHVRTIRSLQYTIHLSCLRAGWYTDLETGLPKERNFGEVIALMHSRAIRRH